MPLPVQKYITSFHLTNQVTSEVDTRSFETDIQTSNY